MENNTNSIVPFVPLDKSLNHMSLDNSASNLNLYLPQYAGYYPNPDNQRKLPSTSINFDQYGMAYDPYLGSNQNLVLNGNQVNPNRNQVNPNAARNLYLVELQKKRANQLNPNQANQLNPNTKLINMGFDCGTFCAIVLVFLIAWIVYFM